MPESRENYEVTFCDRLTNNKWTVLVEASSFANAEKYARQIETLDEIISITKDYENEDQD